MNNTNDITLLQFKLHSFTDENKRDQFVNHLDNISKTDNNINFVVAGDAVLIECAFIDLSNIYYESFSDWANNINPIIVVPDDCDYTNALSSWDKEQLGMKRYIKECHSF